MNEIKRLITTVLLVAVIVGAGMYFAMGSQGEVSNDVEPNTELREQLEEQEDRIKELEKQLEEEELEEDTEDDGETDEIASKCNFDHGLDLKRGANLDIFGEELLNGEEFETVICGHFEAIEGTGFDEDVTNAYLAVHGFEDEEFKKGLSDAVNGGNTVNAIDEDFYLFNLGCFDEGTIKGVEFSADKQYINAETRRAILASTLEDPVTLLLSFGERPETGCLCCNLANTVRVIK